MDYEAPAIEERVQIEAELMPGKDLSGTGLAIVASD